MPLLRQRAFLTVQFVPLGTERLVLLMDFVHQRLLPLDGFVLPLLPLVLRLSNSAQAWASSPDRALTSSERRQLGLQFVQLGTVPLQLCGNLFNLCREASPQIMDPLPLRFQQRLGPLALLSQRISRMLAPGLGSRGFGM